MNMKKIILLWAVFIWVSHFKVSDSFALSISPSRADFSVKAGESCIKGFFINNNEENSIWVKAVISDVIKLMPEMVEFKGRGDFTLKREYLLSKYTSIYPDKLYIPPGEVGKMNLKISMPKDAKGEYYGSIFFEASHPEGETKENPISISVGKKMGMALYIAVEGTEIFECEIGKFEILTADPLKLKLSVKNLGNIHIRPQGYVMFKKKENAEELQLALNEMHAPILPNMELDVGNKKGEVKLVPGEYVASIHLEYGKEGLLNKKFHFIISENSKVGPIREGAPK